MGKFIDWLFEKGDTETAEDRVFKNTSNEEVSGHVVDFKELKKIEEYFIIKQAHIGSDMLEIEFNKKDIEEFNEDNRDNKQNIFNKYIDMIRQKAYTLGYEAESHQTNYHRIYESFIDPDKEKLISTIEEYFKLNRFCKSEVKTINKDILGKKYTIERKTCFSGYNYYLDNFAISLSLNYTLSFTDNVDTLDIPNNSEQETGYVLNQLEKELRLNNKLQEYLINNSLSEFKIKIKEQRDDVAIDMLKIEVMSQIKEDFYQYSHTVYIEKKRLYELIKNDSTFEEILEVK